MRVTNEFLKELNFNPSNLAMVRQKGYLINEGTYQAIGTESVRGCYAIVLFHPEKQAIIHWDDNTRRDQLNQIVEEFLQDIVLEDCTVYLTGGWSDNPHSLKTGDFLTSYFENRNFKIILEGYQEKIQKSSSLSEMGFCHVTHLTQSLSKAEAR